MAYFTGLAHATVSGLPVLAALLLGSLLGCGDDGTAPPGPPASLSVSPLPGRIEVGATASLSATVEDASGRSITGVPVRWESRDTTTVTVDASGGVTGVRMGEAFIVAEAGTASDSALVEVHHVLLAGRARIRVKGVDTFEADFANGAAIFVDVLGRDAADGFQTLFLTPTGPDTAFVTLQAGMVSEGVTELPDWDPATLPEVESGLDVEAPAAYVVIEKGLGSALLLASAAPSRMEVELEDVPPGPGTAEGRFTARVVAELRRYRVEPGADGFVFEALPGRDTLVADLRPTFRHWAVGNSRGRVDGGPAEVEWELRETWWTPTLEGLYRLDVEDGPPDIEVVSVSAAEGVTPVSTDPGPTRVSMRQWAPPRYEARGVSGIFEITRFVPPSGSLFGEVVGTLQAEMLGTDEAGATFPLGVAFDFHAPVFSVDAMAARKRWTPATAASLVRSLAPLIRRPAPSPGAR